MGRLIDADRLKDILEYGILCNVPNDAINTNEEKWNDWVQEVVDKAPTVEAIPKADYESRLKADMVAILTEIQLEIEESKNCGKAFHLGLQMASNIIQQKIQAIEGIKNGR